MDKDKLIDNIIKSCNEDKLSKRLTEDILNAAFDSIYKSIKRYKRFSYPGFGTFKLRYRKARLGRNPQTGAEIQIKATKIVNFKAAPKLKNSISH